MSGPGDIPVSCSSTWGPGLQGPFACVFSRSCPFPWASGILFWHHCPLLADPSALSFSESPLRSTHRGSLGVGRGSYFFLSNTHLDFPSPAWIFPGTTLFQCHGARCPLPKRGKTLSKLAFPLGSVAEATDRCAQTGQMCCPSHMQIKL